MRLSKDERREQLLDVAMSIVREEGADALTLVTLAAKAGVSRPIAYEHFTTRAGLLVALYQRLEDQYSEALRAAVAEAPDDLSAVAEIMADAYFNCHSRLGPEAPAISAALKGSEEMAARQREVIGEYLEIMRQALKPFSAAKDAELRLLCIGLLGAAEAMAQEEASGRVAKAAAVRALAVLIAKSIGGPMR